MTWNTTKTWAVGDSFTASDANAYLRDDMDYAQSVLRTPAADYDALSVWNNGGNVSYVYFSHNPPDQIKVVIEKRQADTDLLFRYFGSCWSSVVPGGCRFGANMDGGGGEFDGRLMFFNVAYHEAFAGAVVIPGGVATVGTHTLSLIVKTVSGGAVINTDANDSVHVEACEVSLD